MLEMKSTFRLTINGENNESSVRSEMYIIPGSIIHRKAMKWEVFKVHMFMYHHHTGHRDQNHHHQKCHDPMAMGGQEFQDQLVSL